MMLLAQVLMRLLRLWDNVLLEKLPEGIQSEIPIVLFQILNQTLRSQDSGGSWNQSREISAYSILTLTTLYTLPWATSLRDELDSAITAGRKFIKESPLGPPDNIWIEKVSYGSPVLCQAYCLSAINASVDSRPWKGIVNSLACFQPKSVNGFSQFFARLPIFAKELNWKLRASLIEAFSPNTSKRIS